MRKHVIFAVGILLIGLVTAGGLWIPIAPQNVAMVALPVSRMVTCPVGNAQVGATTIMLADQELFSTVELDTKEESDPAFVVTIEEAESVILARGSSSLGGFSRFVEPAGVMAVPCAPPITWGAWNGVNTEVGDPVFILTNVDDVSAVIDVHIFGETGPLTHPGLSDIPVGTGTTQVLVLDQYVTSETPVSVVIRATKGRVSAMLRVTSDAGTDWQLPQTSADTDLIIAGIPAGFGDRILSITNLDPEHKTTVGLTILSETGSFEPLVTDSFEVGPARTKTVDITPWLGGQASAVHLVSDRPITATIRLEGKGIAGVSPSPALGGELVFPPVEATLWLANPSDEAVNVIIRTETPEALEATAVDVGPGHILGLPFPQEGTAVLIATSSMTLRASLILADESLTVLPLWGGGAAVSVSVPGIDPGLG